MAEIRALPWNGFTAASTFSGCGGSSLGYRMAGFRVGWASEFIPAAQDTYRANAAPYTILDTRDIREVTARDILDALGLAVGELDVYDGSPPCAAFSTAGKGAAGWGVAKAYSDTVQRVDDLFFEYARLLEELQPRTFIAENVSGLVKGAAKGYFKLILTRLKACGYRVEARLLNAARLGVPQARQRLIFVGVRNDLGYAPAYPSPLPYVYTVREALPWILAQGDNGAFGAGTMRPPDQPSPTIGATPQTGNGRFPASKVIGPAGPRLIHDTSGERGQGDITDKPAPTITVGGGMASHHFHMVDPAKQEETAVDPETGENIHIGRYAIGAEWLRLAPGGKSLKYKNLDRPHPDKPFPTVLVKGGDVSAASATHWAEARKLTLRELRAIGGFPDDFTLTGTYAQRWERIGRAVPPVMMSHIAAAVRDQVLIPLREAGRI
ncbi:DNA cytosine methyltransferase [Streptomyces sp. G1]|uniref:DNA cytosine methyltransferase n=1 Tax=Streptomyces sp. G1 TaxID=361572 RepID=UPI00202FFECA|nr:DNA cytosine methyltransferase [Streptomyces sp. G1]MCM1964854.1 DNA cytosine methyltransferase [Streptomyces sp. G1]